MKAVPKTCARSPAGSRSNHGRTIPRSFWPETTHTSAASRPRQVRTRERVIFEARQSAFRRASTKNWGKQ
jgi:hypothetical protein